MRYTYIYTTKQIEKKELEFMAPVTEMVGQTNAKERSHTSATEADTMFTNFIYVRNLLSLFICQI